jgi:ABC-type uncharacterized transport system substrate-binding protein
VTTLNTEVGPKRLELVRELLPSASAVALLVNPKGPNPETLTVEMKVVANRLGVDLLLLHASGESDFDPVFLRLAEHRANALVITTEAFFISRIEQLARLALRYAVPAIFQYRQFVAAGGLMSYGGSFTDSFRQVGVYAGRVLKSSPPICPCNRRPISNCSSTSRPPRPWASMYLRRCSPELTR